MKDLFLSYELSVEFKKLGLDIPCLAFYDIRYNALSGNHSGELMLGKDPEHLTSENKMMYIFGQSKCLAPLYSQIFDWVREKHNINAWVSCYQEEDDLNIDGTYSYFIYKDKQYMADQVDFETHKKAEIECIKQIIKLLK